MTPTKLPFMGYDKLTVAERKAFDLLKAVRGQGMWAEGIQAACSKPTLEKVRRMFRDIRHAAVDAEREVREIVGDEALTAVKAINEF
jgi:hypothetical protein